MDDSQPTGESPATPPPGGPAIRDSSDPGRTPGPGTGKVGRLLRSESVAGVLKLSGGSGLVQLITFASAPILTRIYSPADYGTLAVFNSIAMLLIVVSSARYELAVMLPENDDEAVDVAGLALLLTALTAVLTLVGVGVAVLVFPAILASALGLWVLLIPLTVLAGGWSAIFIAMANRRGAFGLIATMGVIRKVIGTAASIGLGLLGSGAGGLLLGGFFSISSANLRLGRPVVRELRRRPPDRPRLVAVARRYRRFPLHTLPASLLNSGYLNGLPLVVGFLFGAVPLGLFSLATRMVTVPAQVIGLSIGQVYYRRASELQSSPASSRRLFDRTVARLAVVSVLPFALLAVSAPRVFDVVFGPEWAVAGEYLQLITPMLWIRFVTAPVATTSLVHRRNQIGLLGDLAQFTALLITAAVTWAVGGSLTAFLLALSGSISVILLVTLLANRRSIPIGTDNQVGSG